MLQMHQHWRHTCQGGFFSAVYTSAGVDPGFSSSASRSTDGCVPSAARSCTCATPSKQPFSHDISALNVTSTAPPTVLSAGLSHTGPGWPCEHHTAQPFLIFPFLNLRTHLGILSTHQYPSARCHCLGGHGHTRSHVSHREHHPRWTHSLHCVQSSTGMFCCEMRADQIQSHRLQPSLLTQRVDMRPSLHCARP